MAKNISYMKKSVADFSARISAAWHKATISIFEVGAALIEAKGQLSPRDYRDLIRDLEDRRIMSRSTISKLMTVASNAVLTKPDYQNKLPPSYVTLYMLSRRENDRLEQAIIEGQVTSETQQREVAHIFDSPKNVTVRPKSNRISIIGDLKLLSESQMQRLTTLLKSIGRIEGFKVSGITLD